MASKAELEEAYADATRTAARSAVMGALGFGGLAGGAMFTLLTLCAKTAKRCRTLLEQER